MSDMKTELEEIRDREAKATPGPWATTTYDGLRIVASCDNGERDIAFPARYEACPCEGNPCAAERRANADFIAHARQDIPTLLSHISELEERIAFLEKVAEEMRGFIPNTWETWGRDVPSMGEYLRTQGGRG